MLSTIRRFTSSTSGFAGWSTHRHRASRCGRGTWGSGQTSSARWRFPSSATRSRLSVSLFPMGRMEAAYSVLLALRVVAAGLAAAVYFRKMGARPLPAAIGVVLYVFFVVPADSGAASVLHQRDGLSPTPSRSAWSWRCGTGSLAARSLCLLGCDGQLLLLLPTDDHHRALRHRALLRACRTRGPVAPAPSHGRTPRRPTMRSAPRLQRLCCFLRLRRCPRLRARRRSSTWGSSTPGGCTSPRLPGWPPGLLVVGPRSWALATSLGCCFPSSSCAAAPMARSSS